MREIRTSGLTRRAIASHPASRFNSRATCIEPQLPWPDGVGTPLSFSVAAMARWLATTAARSSAMTGASLATLSAARAWRVCKLAWRARRGKRADWLARWRLPWLLVKPDRIADHLSGPTDAISFVPFPPSHR
jgi:hypothetical protein